MKKGFTLVELAIVLIIISIVIGAIIGSRDLIESAKLNGIISDLKKYESAYNDFKQKYGAVPGDMPDASSVFEVPDANCPELYNGDGNNLIGHPLYIGQGPGYWEVYTVIDMLSKAGLIDFKPKQESLTCGYIGSGSNIINDIFPKAFLEGSTYYFRYDNLASNGIDNYLYFVANNLETGDIPFGSPLTPLQAISIDKKIDDGLPLSGILVGLDNNDGCADNPQGPPSERFYTKATETKSCYLAYSLHGN